MLFLIGVTVGILAVFIANKVATGHWTTMPETKLEDE
jgi:hypothetical protein